MQLSWATKARRIALIGLAIAALSACGDDDDGPTPTPDGGGTADAGPRDAGGGGTDAGPPRTDAGRDAGQATNTIVDIASSNPSFSILVAAATRADLVDALSAGELTLFAPNDAAFAASGITRAMVDELPVAALRGILEYHVLEGEVTASEIEAGPVQSLGGPSLILGTTGGVTINGGNAVSGGANVTMADIDADNGVIHVIDRVLLPPTVADLARYAGLTTLAGAVTSQGLADDLAGTGPFTVFAPTNEAFTALGTLPTGAALTNVLLYHVIGARVPAAEVPAGAGGAPGVASSLLENASGENVSLLFRVTGGTVQINGGNTRAGGANVVVADVFATNGVVHVIDRVLLPPTVVDLAVIAGLSTLAGAVTSQGLAPALSGAGPFTVFAPTNEAFTALGTLPTGAALTNVLRYHVIGASVPAADVPPGTADAPGVAGTLAENTYGDNLSLLFRVTGGTVRINGGNTRAGGANVALADVIGTNGVVHVVDRVLLPMNVVDAATAGGLTGLLTAVGAAAEIAPGTTVAGALAAQAPYTVFAPTNAAFAALPSTPPPATLRDVLLYHVLSTTAFPAPVLSDELPTTNASLGTLNAAAIPYVAGPPPTFDGADLVQPDIVVTNGVIHIIDAVMLP